MKPDKARGLTRFLFQPKLLSCLREYTSQLFVADLTTGVTVGIVTLPLSMAFAIASGMPPQAGIFTAVIAGFIISALGGTRVSIGGPTGAFIVILYGILSEYGAGNLAICTVMAGVILFVMGAARLGGQSIRCEYAEARSIIYQVFAQMSRHLQPPAEQG